MNDNILAKIIEPFTIKNKLTLKNRLVMAPMTTVSGEPDGSFSMQEIDYLGQRAQDGIGLIMSPACYCHKSGHSFVNQVGCHDDSLLDSLSKCAEAINKHGSASFLQIFHGGNAAKSSLSGEVVIAPSAVHNRRGTSELPREMNQDEIKMIIQSFADASVRAKKAGFTGVEIHGANTYLFQQFFSPFTNKRTDQYGKDRTLFAQEVVIAVREAVGDDYPIAYRLSPEEPEPDGYTIDDSIQLLKKIVPLGIDIVHISQHLYGKPIRENETRNPALEIKKAMPDDVAVIGVGGFNVPEDIDPLFEDNLELSALGKTLLLNHDWLAKVRENKISEIKKTIKSEVELESLQLPELMKNYIKKWYFPEQ